MCTSETTYSINIRHELSYERYFLCEKGKLFTKTFRRVPILAYSSLNLFAIAIPIYFTFI